MRILIIDKDSSTVRTLKVVLRMVWPSVSILETSDGLEGIDMVRTEQPDAVVLDLALSGMSGIDVIAAVRTFSGVPIIVASEGRDELVKVRAFEVGADEYICKPFDPLGLLVRFKAVVRRAYPTWGGGDRVLPIGRGEVSIDSGSQRMSVDGSEVPLTPAE